MPPSPLLFFLSLPLSLASPPLSLSLAPSLYRSLSIYLSPSLHFSLYHSPPLHLPPTSHSLLLLPLSLSLPHTDVYYRPHMRLLTNLNNHFILCLIQIFYLIIFCYIQHSVPINCLWVERTVTYLVIIQ